MDAQDVSDLVNALVLVAFFAPMAGALTWSMSRAALVVVSRWFDKRSKPLTPAQLLSMAAGMRKRAAVLTIEAEKLRLATLSK